MNYSFRRPIVVCLLVGILILCEVPNSLAGSSGELERNKALVMKAAAVLDTGALDDLDRYFTTDYVRHSQATPDAVVRSLDDFKNLLREWSHTFSNIVTTVDVLVAEGDLVAFYGSYTATQSGRMGPFPATGKKMVSEFAGFHRIAGGKIAETWVTWDNLSTLVQLGLFPVPERETDSSE